MIFAFAPIAPAFAIGLTAIKLLVRPSEIPPGPGERGSLPVVPYGEERLPE